MPRGINKVIILGNLGNDPEARHTPTTNSLIVTVSVATSNSWRDKITGELKEHTEWHRVVFFGRLAEIARDYLRKGSLIYVEGTLRTRKWQDKNGQDRYTTEIVGNEMQMLGGRNNSNSNYGNGNQGNQNQQQQQQPQQQYNSSNVGNQMNNSNENTQNTMGVGAPSHDEDDIPF